ncbi:hypothetical protein TWF694_005865 [Orbilia ellipsospora]|uniref:DUF7029 domain-containing protein n=1 Tax=Orbilia ellipsospora TaxID=2528407 RepID=A0AAV9WY86_9PEZI
MVLSRLLPFIYLGLFGLQAQAEEWYIPANNTIETLALVPVREDHLNPHLHRRDDDLSRLVPQHRIQMHFGKALSHEHLRIADVTANNTHHPLVLLEKFDDLTDSIMCTEDDKIALKFKTKQGMTAAIAAWDWVNSNQTDHFFLITHHHHKGCGPDEDRIPHRVIDVNSNDSNLTVVLTKQPASWEESLKTFDIKIHTINHPWRHLLDTRTIQTRELVAPDLSKEFNSLTDKGCKSLQLGSWCNTLMWIYAGPTVSVINGMVGTETDLLNTGLEAVKDGYHLLKDANDLFFGDGLHKHKEFHWGDPNKPDEKKELTKLYKGKVDIEGKITCTGCYVQGDVDFNMGVFWNGEAPRLEVNFVTNVKGKASLDIDAKVTKEVDFNPAAEVANAFLKTTKIGKLFKVLPEVTNGLGVILKGEATTGVNFPSIEVNLSKFNFEMSLEAGKKPQFAMKNWREDSIKVAEPKFKGINVDLQVNPYFRLGYGIGAEFLSGKAKLGFFAGLEPRIENSFKMTGCGPEGVRNGTKHSEYDIINSAKDALIKAGKQNLILQPMALIQSEFLKAVNTDLITITSDVKLNVRVRPVVEIEPLGGSANGDIEIFFKKHLGELFDGCTLGSMPLLKVNLVDRCRKNAPLLEGNLFNTSKPVNERLDFKWTEWEKLKECAGKNGTLGAYFLPEDQPFWWPPSGGRTPQDVSVAESNGEVVYTVDKGPNMRLDEMLKKLQGKYIRLVPTPTTRLIDRFGSHPRPFEVCGQDSWAAGNSQPQEFQLQCDRLKGLHRVDVIQPDGPIKPDGSSLQLQVDFGPSVRISEVIKKYRGQTIYVSSTKGNSEPFKLCEGSMPPEIQGAFGIACGRANNIREVALVVIDGKLKFMIDAGHAMEMDKMVKELKGQTIYLLLMTGNKTEPFKLCQGDMPADAGFLRDSCKAINRGRTRQIR